MKNKLVILSILFSCFFYQITDVYGQKEANTLLTKMDEISFGIKDKSATLKMVMVNLKTGKQEVKKAILFQKDADKKLFRYTFPRADSGIATLSLPNDEVYLYLPLFKNPKKITNLAENNTYNKSDFSFEDMATRSYQKKYIPELITATDTSYVMDLKPKWVNSSYSHVIVTQDKNYFYPERLEYYNKKNQKVKEAFYHFTKLQDYWIADTVFITDLKKQHRTKIIMSEIKINSGLKDDLFSVKNLKAMF